MSSPFLGLSVLVHLGIIVVCKLSAPLRNLHTRRSVDVAAGQTFVVSSMLIMVAMSGLVVTGAVGIVYKSVTDEHSSIRFVHAYLENMPAAGVALASAPSDVSAPSAFSHKTNTTTSAFTAVSFGEGCSANPDGGYCQIGEIVFNYPR